ncbi:hypothetical protein MRI28_18745 [Nocardiopsis dassonvillei]|uniref:hypothetical protein n=1 Tax=Nocardiopsis dassonvillei TaxID=2014 RepID=UPI00200CB1E2|nr:hypothetical protein [Nocardiopsis dassonvillei]MCK9871650.1 hypothetical protein [Nocardiopsis dassonvillei]
MSDMAKVHVRKILLAWCRNEANTAKRIVELAGEGTRVVKAHPGGAYTDALTSEVLLTGQESEETVARIQGDQDWLHIDYIWESSGPPAVEPTPGVPASLAAALEDWLSVSTTPDEEVAEYIGWSVAEVKACREE